METIMQRILILLYGVVAYVMFLGVFLYAVGFVLGVPFLPKTIDSGPVGPVVDALVVNLLLMSLFAVQHSGMARKGFKQWWTKVVPVAMERSTFVLATNVVFILLFWQWRPIPTVVWQVPIPEVAIAIQALAAAGVVIVLVATFLINHFELFGLQQVVLNMLGKKVSEPTFKTPGLYKLVRHPIYFGFIVAFWAAPVMTIGHLLFAAVTTAYIFVGIALEERDLIAQFGDDYRRYRERVAMMIPFWRAQPDARTPQQATTKELRKAA
jgi:protein-S-isoprenylcysteine O-methyltransferase Ste14